MNEAKERGYGGVVDELCAVAGWEDWLTLECGL
jgi:hypothetical protein